MRKITELEQKLIAAGFWLDSKNYFGKKSEYTLSYVYRGILSISPEDDPFGVWVELDSKREEIIGWGIPNVAVEVLTPQAHAEMGFKLATIAHKLEEVGIETADKMTVINFKDM